MALADVVNALAYERVCTRGMTCAAVRALIEQRCGKHFGLKSFGAVPTRLDTWPRLPGHSASAAAKRTTHCASCRPSARLW